MSPPAEPSRAAGESECGVLRWLSPRAVFLALGGSFGLFFALATPPHDPPDEARHHARAWLISGGDLYVVGEAPGHAASVPRDITQLHPQAHHFSTEQLENPLLHGARRTAPHSPAERFEQLRGSLSRWNLQPVRLLTPYNPVVYVPYVPALWIARGLELSAAAGLLLARLAGLAGWLAGIALVLRVAPSQRFSLAAVALLPLSVFQGASLSADPFSQVAIFWFFAEWLRAATAPPAGVRGYARLLAAALSLGLVKPGYAPLAAACVFLPLAPLRRGALAAATLAAAALPTLWWARVLAAAREPAVVAGADAAAQLRFMLDHPLAFLAAVADTCAALHGAWLEGMVGNIGHFDVEIPAAATALGLGAVAASATLERVSLGPWLRLGGLAAFLLTGLCLFAMAYLGWTAVGAESIPGVQGRYFLPLLPFALLALPALPRALAPALRLAVTTALALVLGVTAHAMLRSYYVW